MAEILDDQAIQAGAILYLLDTGNEVMANALLACQLTITGRAKDQFDTVEIAGREPDLQKLRALPRQRDILVKLFGGSYGAEEALNARAFTAIQGAMSKSYAAYLDNNSYRIRLRAALSASADYQGKVRRLVESSGVDVPTIGGLRVRREGREYQLKPISIFPVGTFERDAKLCFVLMPFALGFQSVYERGIRHAVEGQGLTCRRGDDILQAGDIIGQIWSSLIRAQLVIADLTGANGNVLYELGLAHMMGHQAILLAQDISSVPFDLRQQRHIIYSSSESGLQKLTAALSQAIRAMLAQ